jgi:hypothetical protein
LVKNGSGLTKGYRLGAKNEGFACVRRNTARGTFTHLLPWGPLQLQVNENFTGGCKKVVF